MRRKLHAEEQSRRRLKPSTDRRVSSTMFARRTLLTRDSGDVADDYEAVDVARAPRRKLVREMSPAEVRRQRDLVWLLLADAGLSTREIEVVCSQAAKDHTHIARRIAAARRHHHGERRHAG
jgi:hypothetical protein